MKRTGLTALILLLAGSLFAQEGREVMEKVENRQTPRSSRALVTMVLQEKGESPRERQVEMLMLEGSGGLSRSLIIFRSPQSVANTRFLNAQNEGSDDDKWIYLPALKKVRRIASSEGNSSFMGTDFTYDDMSTRELDDYTYTLLKEETIKGYDCWVVESLPKEGTDSQYSKTISWIGKESLNPVKVEMYDQEGALLKVAETGKLEEIQGHWTIMVNTMTNVQTDHSTTIRMEKIQYDRPLNPKLFTPRFLETGRL